ncbi:MAG: hypothetical protein RMJ66_06565 [Bacteroidia bacterium]|nr:hypothetical protein [Bacteroidia bacterium]MDW8134714.1 hypothetical protein [Bacteroidia bacterium]
MRFWKGLGLTILLSLVGCSPADRLFRTPYDKALRAELRKRKGGWVMRGPSDTLSVMKSSPYLQAGQFLRVVLEMGAPLSEEPSALWQLVRIDTLRIFEDGVVYIPWGGSIRLGGLSLDSACRALELLARKTFLRAQVRLYPLYPYYIFGHVQHSGPVLLDKMEVSLLEILPFLSNQQWEVNLKRLKVIRGDPHNPQVFLIDIRDATTLSAAFRLRSGDIIVAEPRSVVFLRIEFQNYLVILSVFQLLNFVLLLALQV